MPRALIVPTPFYKRPKNSPEDGTWPTPQIFGTRKDHEWIKVEGEIGTIGITDYAQHELGDVVFVELPKVGAKLQGR